MRPTSEDEGKASGEKKRRLELVDAVESLLTSGRGWNWSVAMVEVDADHDGKRGTKEE